MNFFGTDGIRGVANVHPLTPEFAMRVTMAAVKAVRRHYKTPKGADFVLVGSDTRCSSPMLIYSVSAAAMSLGFDVVNLEVIPTSGISYLVKKMGAAFAIMISASHNPFMDNGIKIFGPDGFKLSDEIETAIEQELFNETSERPAGESVGRVRKNSSFLVDPASEYAEYVASLIEHGASQSRKKLKIVIDGANGAASPYVRKIFDARFNLEMINCTPDGKNINFNCGSTHTGPLAKIVKDSGADIGIAFDGDADRALFVDEKGAAVDGDQAIAMLAIDMKQRGELKNNVVVTTVMSNLGFINSMKRQQIDITTTTVGDRNVLGEMIRRGGVLGGEQSGHILMLDKNNTGDGLITAVSVLNLMKRTGRKLSELASCVQKYPQVLINVSVSGDKNHYKTDPDIVSEIKRAEEKFLNRGRVLIRPSGTENIVRVMIEGENKTEITNAAEDIAAKIREKMA